MQPARRSRRPGKTGVWRLVSQGLGLVIALGAFAAAALIGFLYLTDPPGRDQGVFAYIGWRWLHGEIPYLEAGLEHKGPLPFAAYALSLSLFGHSMSAIRLHAWLATLVGGLGVTWITTRVSGRLLYGLFAGAVYLLFVSVSGLGAYWNGAQAEAFMEPLVIASILIALLAGTPPGAHGDDDAAPAAAPAPGAPAVHPPRRARWWFLAGVCLGTATLGKPTALAVIVALLAALPRFDLLRAGAIVAGLLIPWAAAVGYFAYHQALRPFIEQVFLLNIVYGSEGLRSIPGVIGLFPNSFRRLLDVRLFALIVPGAYCAIRRWPKLASRVVLSWLIASFVEVLAQGRLWSYHFYPIMAPLAVLWGRGLAHLGEVLFAHAPAGAAMARLRVTPWQRLGAALLIAIGVWGLAGLNWREARFRYHYAIGDVSEDQFLAHFTPRRGRSDVDPVETFRAAAWARANLTPEETLLVWGFEPAVNFLSERRSPTRFIYDYYLTSETLPESARAAAWRLFWSDVDADPPDWIAIVHNDQNVIEPRDSVQEIERVPEFKAYLERNYRREVRIGDFEFLRREAAL